MLTAYDKGISLLNNSTGTSAQPISSLANHIHLNLKHRSDLRLLDLTNMHDLTLLHQIGSGQSRQPEAMVREQNQDLIELLIQLHSIDSRKHPWIDERGLNEPRNTDVFGCLISVSISQNPQTASYNTLPQLLKECRNRQFTETSLQRRQSGYPGLIDDHMEQPLNNVIYFDRYADGGSLISRQFPNDVFTLRHIEIELLKRSIFGTRKRLSSTNIKLKNAILKIKKLRQMRLDLKTALQLQLTEAEEDNNARLAELQEKHQQRVLELETDLFETNRSASDNLADAEAKISALRMQIEEKESSRQQLQQEKTALAGSLQAETSHNLEFVQQIESLDQRIKSLETELKTAQQTGKQAELQYNKARAAAKEELEQAKKTIQVLKDSNQQLEHRLEQELTDFSNRQERMNQALEAEKQLAREQQTHFEAKIKTLNQQLEDSHLEASRKLQQERQQSQADYSSLQEKMKQTLATEKQTAEDEQRRLESVIDGLNQKLETSLAMADQQLDKTRHQARADIQALQEQMDQALEAETKKATEEKSRLAAEIESLDQQLQANRADMHQQLTEARQQARVESQKLQEQLKTIRAEASRQRDNQLELETLLEQERNTNNELKDLLKTTETALNESNKRIADIEMTHQETLSELLREQASNEDAWSKLAESEVESQTAKQELSSLRYELEETITNLRAQLEHQQQSGDVTIRRYKEENSQLQQSLQEIQEKSKLAFSTIRQLKQEQASQSESKAHLEDKLVKLQTEAETKQAELIATIESERQEKASLQQLLKNANVQSENPSAIQRTKEENMLLKRKIKDMREAQSEKEDQPIVDGNYETRILHEELKVTQAKLKIAEKLAAQSKTLLRENQIHESAIDMLSDDLDALTAEKESLIAERDGLIKKLGKIKEHYSNRVRKDGRLH